MICAVKCPKNRVRDTADHRRGEISADRNRWDDHWTALSTGSSFFGRIASRVRIHLLSRAVRHWANDFFSDSGVFVEMGCGTAQSSSRLDRQGRGLIGLDFSLAALASARRMINFSGFVQGDIRRLGFRGGTISGIWNLGVMEHFPEDQGQAILREFRRVLVPGGVVVLFWPPGYGSSRILLGPVEKYLSWRHRKPFAFFPDEVNRLRSRTHGRELLLAAGFEAEKVTFSWRDLWIHIVAVGRKPVQ